jgi:glycosyltransferase involved in cell wall biosynthesis
MQTTISVVIPCYNEEESLPHLRPRLAALGQLLGERYELEFVFVDDGSTDGTRAVLAETPGWGLPGAVQLHRHEANAGLGAALQTGFRAARGELVVPFDCDGTLDPALLPPMLDAMDDQTDIVSGSDLHPDGACLGVPWHRLMLHKGVSEMYRWLFWSRLHSFSLILRVYRRRVFDRIDIQSRGFLSCTEILMKAVAEGFVVKEYPVILTVRIHGRSKIRIARTIRDHLGFMVSLRLTLWARRLRQLLTRRDVGKLPASLG